MQWRADGRGEPHYRLKSCQAEVGEEVPWIRTESAECLATVGMDGCPDVSLRGLGSAWCSAWLRSRSPVRGGTLRDRGSATSPWMA